MRDMKHNIAFRQSMAVGGRAAGDVGTEVDRLGFESLTFATRVVSWSEGITTLIAQHRDDGEDWATVSATDLIGAMPVVNSNALNGQILTVGYIGEKRYVRPITTATGLTASPSQGAIFGVDVILGHPNSAPVT